MWKTDAVLTKEQGLPPPHSAKAPAGSALEGSQPAATHRAPALTDWCFYFGSAAASPGAHPLSQHGPGRLSESRDKGLVLLEWG